MILGVDPGSRITGYAFIQIPRHALPNPRAFKIIDAGALKAPSVFDIGIRMGLMHQALHQLVVTHKPTVGIFEKPFFGKNASTTIRLAETRGALMAACSREKVKLQEITPAEVKKLITGSGRADKEMVVLALKSLINFDLQGLPFDVADAVAIALCYGMQLSHRFTPRVPVLQVRPSL